MNSELFSSFAWISCVGLFMLSCASCEALSPRENAELHGAKARIKVVVVDEDNLAVSNAEVQVYFGLSIREGKTVNGLCNEEGTFSAEGKTTGEVYVDVRKKGFYQTSEKLELFLDEQREVRGGRWMPDEIVTNVVLRPIGTPVELRTPEWSTDLLIPKGGVVMGVDLERQDWVRPFGKGDVVDFEIVYESDGKKQSEYSGSKLRLRFVRPFDGAYVQKMDTRSMLKTCHSANTNAVFKQDFLFWEERGMDRKIIGSVPGKDEYLVLRTRSRVDGEGRFLGGQYSKIVGGISFGWCFESFGFLGFKSFINPTFNDPNLEEMNIYNTPNFRTIGRPSKKK